ncbi:MAG: patatin-like phospholipase family protein [Pseudomonadota bacterium]
MDDQPTEGRDTPLPFTNMAISLSGGGFRATAFHLGALSYLDQRRYKTKTLLENVSIISTISGGTLTGIMYALKLAKGGNFADCFDTLYNRLKENQLVDLALKKLNTPQQWKNTAKTRDLINAFAEVYNEEFFDEATFDTLYQDQQTHLQNAIFGASEFTYGTQFRFQESDGAGRFGNNYLKITKRAAAEVRLADAAAASSCFPGGFEPMIMPTDFGNGPGSAVEKAWFERPNDRPPYPVTAIMDGGVIDNQGIEGVKLVESRSRSGGKPFIGTFLISDVSADSMIPYAVPQLKPGGYKNLLTLRLINRMGSLLALLIGALLLFGILPKIGVIVSTVILTLLGIWFLGYFFVNRAIVNEITSVFGTSRAAQLIQHLQVLKKTPLYILIYLLKFRATSMVKMTSDIFLRRIRQLQLRDLYGSDDWNYRIKANNIYSLSKAGNSLPKAMQEIIASANAMPTTLWFSDADVQQNKLDQLIACGQFTMCYNLINYIDRLQRKNRRRDVWGTLEKQQQQQLLELQADMQKDWVRFEENPYWMLQRYRDNTPAPAFA